MTRPAARIRRLAIILGDTPGHVYPALALAEAWRQRPDPVEIFLIGPRTSGALSVAEREGYPVSLIDARPLARESLAARAGALAHLTTTIAQSRQLIAARRVRLVIGLGSFASGGALLAARSLGICTAIHESNVVPGLANRLLARIAHQIYLGFGNSGGWAPRSRQVTTGNPVRAAIAALADEPRHAVEGRPAHVLVLGGARGAHFLDSAAPQLLGRVVSHGAAVQIRHQSSNGEAARASYGAAGIEAAIFPFLSDIAAEYRWADFVIARAGGGTIAELAAAGLPALLVPLADAAGNHQESNARAVADAGAAIWVREADWNIDDQAERARALLLESTAWLRMSSAARRLAAPGAAAAVVADAERLMTGRW